MPKKSRKASATAKPGKQQDVSTYRVLAKQALSLEVGDGRVESFSIQGMECRIAVKPSNDDPAKQREFGGSTIAVEFKATTTDDLFLAGRAGMELIEDFLSAITVVSNTTFGPCELVQVARLDAGRRHNCEFMQMLPLPLNHWHERIAGAKLRSARNLLAHWDGMEGGKRLRRAARNYRSAAGVADDVTAFQEAYVGLEVMEKPLAANAGFAKHGTEQVKGSCEKCGHEYVRNRTTLVGVRAFVAGDVDLDKADEGRVADWKLINKLRNDLMHGLVDDDDLGDRPLRALLASMHYLHHAICTCSHASDLASQQYKLARGGAQFVMLGKYSARTWPPLTDWRQIVETKSPMFEWVPHENYGLVPELSFRNDGVKDLRVGVGRLNQPLSTATMTDIGRVQTERDF
ncbi:hypothetical protein ABIB73_000186 [Bradyrhizobium sp. F1.4.3]|uniref:hypothetical protein n=1 Tax=Bradyrhizobium sp. F1.4.3 TaxID=3156356 RepID=UPI00339347CF